MSEPKHKMPLRTEPPTSTFGLAYIYDAEGCCIASANDLETAQLFINAVNYHERLKAALGAMTRTVEKLSENRSLYRGEELWLEDARNLLKEMEQI